jgi:hypothetical protein
MPELFFFSWGQRHGSCELCPSDLHYIVVGIVLLVSAGIGIMVASQIVDALMR